MASQLQECRRSLAETVQRDEGKRRRPGRGGASRVNKKHGQACGKTRRWRPKSSKTETAPEGGSRLIILSYPADFREPATEIKKEGSFDCSEYDGLELTPS